MKLTNFEQLTILNSQIENTYNSISNIHKFFSALCSSIGGVSLLLYSNHIQPSNYFNYLYYTLVILFALAAIWFRTLVLYLYDLNQITDEYNNFVKQNKILTLYKLSPFLNVRRCNIIIPFALGVVILALFLRYTNYSSWMSYIEGMFYIIWFYLCFIWKFNLKTFKYL